MGNTTEALKQHTAYGFSKLCVSVPDAWCYSFEYFQIQEG